MTKDVLIKHRKQDTEYLRMLLNLCELPVSYMQTDLIMEASAMLKKLNGDLSLMDAAKLYTGWNDKWDEYFKSQNKNHIVTEKSEDKTSNAEKTEK
jgi:hypothetical protein